MFNIYNLVMKRESYTSLAEEFNGLAYDIKNDDDAKQLDITYAIDKLDMSSRHYRSMANSITTEIKQMIFESLDSIKSLIPDNNYLSVVVHNSQIFFNENCILKFFELFDEKLIPDKMVKFAYYSIDYYVEQVSTFAKVFKEQMTSDDIALLNELIKRSTAKITNNPELINKAFEFFIGCGIPITVQNLKLFLFEIIPRYKKTKNSNTYIYKEDAILTFLGVSDGETSAQ